MPSSDDSSSSESDMALAGRLREPEAPCFLPLSIASAFHSTYRIKGVLREWPSPLKDAKGVLGAVNHPPVGDSLARGHVNTPASCSTFSYPKETSCPSLTDHPGFPMRQ